MDETKTDELASDALAIFDEVSSVPFEMYDECMKFAKMMLCLSSPRATRGFFEQHDKQDSSDE